MKHLIFLHFIIFNIAASAQTLLVKNKKPPLDRVVFENWAHVSGGNISPNGNYVSYISTTKNEGPILAVRSTQSNWRREFKSNSTVEFSANSMMAIFKTTQDTLCLLTLGKNKLSFIPNVATYQLSKGNKESWLAYQLAVPEKELILYNLNSGAEKCFSSFEGHLFDNKGTCLLIGRQGTIENNNVSSLAIISLPEQKLKTIWSGRGHPVNWVFDLSGNQIAFMVEKDEAGNLSYELWYYKKGANKAVLFSTDQNRDKGTEFRLANQTPNFSSDGKRLFFGLRPLWKSLPKTNAVRLDVWSYADTQLQSEQLESLQRIPIYITVMGIGEKQTIRLEQPDERIIGRTNDIALVVHELGGMSHFEAYWNRAAQASFYLVSLRDGSRKLLKDHISNSAGSLQLSPGGKWILYYDLEKSNYFSYEISSGITRNLTSVAANNWTDEENDKPEPSIPGSPSWLTNDQAVLICDSYDVWQIDPAGIKPPLNLTNSYGRKHHIKLELLDSEEILKTFSVEKRSVLLLKAINEFTKDWGFYTKKLGVAGDPELRSMGPYVYESWGGHDSFNYPPVKAEKANIYLITRSNAVNAPNFFLTKDFKNFASLTDVQPQNDYNWISTELVHWVTLNGTPSAGILYKPDNFDPNKKYPIIFNYYEQRSDELNLYIDPKASDGAINIPWFVSNGYLVFVPDIHYVIGEPGQSAFNTIVSAANYLTKFSWVDAKCMGLEGHSFGGFETNYIVAHTAIFAAACAVAGASDQISKYGSGLRGGFPMFLAERGQTRIGVSPWERQDLYIKNSPIYNADQITTPLLLMNNKKDGAVPFEQGVEFFTALRRLGKKVWLLQYDNGNHGVYGADADDFNIRMTQFFDHYLKGAQAPKWMVEGIPAKMKGIDDGLALEPRGVVPGPGLDKKR
ncbi:MAG: alpha/beta hydrolase family protein [Sphingobacteriales bacterium]